MTSIARAMCIVAITASPFLGSVAAEETTWQHCGTVVADSPREYTSWILSPQYGSPSLASWWLLEEDHGIFLEFPRPLYDQVFPGNDVIYYHVQFFVSWHVAGPLGAGVFVRHWDDECSVVPTQGDVGNTACVPVPGVPPNNAAITCTLVFEAFIWENHHTLRPAVMVASGGEATGIVEVGYLVKEVSIHGG